MCYLCKAKESQRGGRNLGGVLVLVRKCYNVFVERVFDTFEYGVLLSFNKNLFHTDNDIMFASLYFPPEGSPFYPTGIRNGLSILEQALCYSDYDFSAYSFILSGDFNARTATLDDFLIFDENIPELQDFSDIFDNDICIKRKSCDKRVMHSEKN